MGDYVPLYMSLTIIFIVGILIPLSISGFVDVDPEEVGGITGGLISYVQDGLSVSFFGQTYSLFNPFNVLGEDLKQSFINYIAAFGYIPNILLIPMMIIVFIGFLYTLIKLLPTT